jgi:probable rRNA maturation factor
MEPGSSRGPAAAGILAGPIAPAVIVEETRWRRLVPRAEVVVLRAARSCGWTGNVVLASDGAVRWLNGRHRGRNKPTNVLTFPPPPGLRGGDIILALGVVRREAAENGRLPAQHLAHLVVHGILHLAGHDHHGAGEARRMEMQEARILHLLGVPNPWKPRP